MLGRSGRTHGIGIGRPRLGEYGVGYRIDEPNIDLRSLLNGGRAFKHDVYRAHVVHLQVAYGLARRLRAEQQQEAPVSIQLVIVR